MNKHLLLLPVGLAVTIGGLALAQSAPEGIDLEAIRERAAEHADDAQALSTNVRQRAEALTEDAQTIQTQAQANRAAYADSIKAIETDTWGVSHRLYAHDVPLANFIYKCFILGRGDRDRRLGCLTPPLCSRCTSSGVLRVTAR